jgi:hypothetical protein
MANLVAAEEVEELTCGGQTKKRPGPSQEIRGVTFGPTALAVNGIKHR